MSAATPIVSVIMPIGNVATQNPGREVFELCLQSVAWADQIVIVDSGSRDDSRELAARFTSEVYVHPYRDSIKRQKELALQYARGDWVLSVDADEILPPALIAEIQAAVRHGTADAYWIWRLHYFLGQPLRHCGRDRVIRLWRRGVGAFAGGDIHEYYQVPGRTAELATPLEHQCTLALGPRLEKQMLWARSQAATAPLPPRARYRRRDVWRLIVRPPLENMYSIYWVNRGYRDGIRGFLWMLISGTGELWSRILLWERAQRERGGLQFDKDGKQKAAGSSH